MKKLFLFFSILFSVYGFGQIDGRFGKIDSLLNYVTSNGKFMGSLSIKEGAKTDFEKAYGFSDLKNEAKANIDTRYKVGSITKIFTSVVVFQLIEEKKLTLETKLSKFFPSIANSEEITIKNLLDHSSGIYSFTDDKDYADYAKLPKTRAEILNKIIAGNPVFEPGENAVYSNSNFVLLGWIIEDITKKSYAENVTARIITKLGLKHTGFPKEVAQETFSYHKLGKNWIEAFKEHESIPGGAGAIVASASDLTKFIDALFAGKLVSQPSLLSMTTIEKGFGKGLFVLPFGERKFYGHTGGIEDFSSVLVFYPKEKLSIALLSNVKSGYNLNDLMIGILSVYYKMPYRFPNFKTAEVSVSVLKKYEGLYSASNFPLKITIKEKEGVLICQATGQESFPLNALSETTFNFDPAGLELEFSTNSMTIFQGGSSFKLSKE